VNDENRESMRDPYSLSITVAFANPPPSHMV
jgi:hypothetical protein